MDISSRDESKIAQAHYVCVEAFSNLVNIARAAPLPSPNGVFLKRIKNVFEKYNLWAGNMGAMQSGRDYKMSLDYRLRDASFFQVQVIRLLKDLKTSIDKATEELKHSSSGDDESEDDETSQLGSGQLTDDDSPWDVSSDSENGANSPGKSPVKLSRVSCLVQNSPDKARIPMTALDMIEFVLSCLWKLPIRQPAPLDRMDEVTAAEISYYQPFDVMHVKCKFPDIDEQVTLRLGKMITKRRQAIYYRKNHTDTLQKKSKHTRHPMERRVVDMKFDADIESSDYSAGSEVPSNRTHDTKATTWRLDSNEPTLDINKNLYQPSISETISSAASEGDDSNLTVIVPKRPKDENGKHLEQFICPYCSTAQNITSDRKWKKHVLKDLEPYVCTYPNCFLHENVFASREAWFNHETQIHRCKWHCNIESHPVFDTASEFIAHMRLQHETIVQERQISALKHLYQQPASSQNGICNLCMATSSKLKKHMSRHLEQLSLFALPRTDYMAESDAGDAESDVAHRSDLTIGDSEALSVESQSGSEGVELFVQDNVDPVEMNEPTASDYSRESEYIQDDSWDNITPKFRQARAHMQGPGTPDESDHQPEPTPEDPVPKEDVATATTKHYEDTAVMNPYYQTRPVCGASIGAFNEQHLPPLSLGGIVLVDGEPYGLTCHHIVEAPSDDEDSEGEGEAFTKETDKKRTGKEREHKGQGATWLKGMGAINTPHKTNDLNKTLETKVSDNKSGVEKSENATTEGHDSGARVVPPVSGSPHAGPAPLWDFDISSDEGFNLSSSSSGSFEEGEYEFSDDDDIEDDDGNLISVGDRPGIEPGEGENIRITQPAIDDVDDDFFPNEEDRDEDHLSAHELGYIYATSGIRRWRRKGVVHEVDWALIKIKPERLQPYNMLNGGLRYRLKNTWKDNIRPPLVEPIFRRFYSAEEDEFPMEVADAESLGGRNVHIVGRTTGLQGGMIGESMNSVRIYHRKDFSRSWSVAGGFGVGGDSGAWVIDNATGAVCGIVLAWCERNHIAYIQPMQVVLEDIKRTLGARKVCLPKYEPEETNQPDFLPEKSDKVPTLKSKAEDLADRTQTKVPSEKLPSYSGDAAWKPISSEHQSESVARWSIGHQHTRS